MLELFKNIGLGIFVNGAYALQFESGNEALAITATLEGILMMALAIYLNKGK